MPIFRRRRSHPLEGQSGSAPTMVYRVPIANMGNPLANTATGFVCIDADAASFGTIRDRTEVRMMSSATIKNLRINISTNSSTTDATFRLVKNGVATAMTVTIPAGITGLFEDTTNSITVVAGDLLVYEMVRSSAETINLSVTTIDELNSDGTTTCIAHFAAGGNANGASVTRFSRVAGSISYGTSESSLLSYAPAGFTAKNAAVFIRTNSRTTTTTFTLRKNGVNTGIAIAVGAGVTGWVTNIINTETYTAGDSLSWAITTGTGTETLEYSTLVFEKTPTTTGLSSFIMGPNGTNMTAALSPRRTILGAGIVKSVADYSGARLKTYGSGTFRNAYSSTTSNSCTSAIDHKIVINGVDTGINAQIPALTNTVASDLVNTYNYSPGQLYYLEVVRGGSGAYTLGSFSFAAQITQEAL